MRKILFILLVASLGLSLGACQQKKADAGTQPVANNQEMADDHGGHMAADHEHKFHVKCGCEIDGVKKCSEFVEFKGKFMPLVLPADVKAKLPNPTMPFCKKKDAEGWIQGEVKDGKAYATSFRFVEK